MVKIITISIIKYYVLIITTCFNNVNCLLFLLLFAAYCRMIIPIITNYVFIMTITRFNNANCLLFLLLFVICCRMSDSAAAAADSSSAEPKKRTFRVVTYRGVELEKLLDLPEEKLVEMFAARQRRKFTRGIKRKPATLLKKLKAAAAKCPQGEKPEMVKTHLRDTTIVPEMIGTIVGVYNGKTFNQVEIKPEMIGHYLGEFSITYKPVRHGRPGIGATHSSRFVPLK